MSQFQAELIAYSEANLSGSPGHLENFHINSPDTNQALMDTLFQEADGQEPPSSAAGHTTLPLLEHEVDVPAQTTQNPLSVGNLDSHIAAATLTHVVSIEDDVPILDIPIPSMGNPPSFPIQRAISTSSVLVHTFKPSLNPLHNLARAANILHQQQCEIQAPFSVDSDLLPSQQGGCETTTSIPLPSITLPPQTGVSGISNDVLLQAIQNLSTKFDVKFREMQSELEELKSNNPKKELAEIKELVLKLTSDLGELKKSRGDVDGIDAGIQQVGERLAQVEQVMAGVSDDAKMGEMNESEPQITQTTQVETQIEGESDEDKMMISSLLKSAKVYKRKISSVEGEQEQSRSKKTKQSLKKKVVRNRYNPKTELFEEFIEIDSEEELSEEEVDKFGLDDPMDKYDEDFLDDDDDDTPGSIAERIQKTIEAESSKSEQPQSEQKQDSQSDQQTQTEKFKTQTEGIKYTNVIEQDSVTKPVHGITIGGTPKLPEDKFRTQLLKYEGKGKKPALSKIEVDELVKKMIDDSKAEKYDELGIVMGAEEAGLTIEEYKLKCAQEYKDLAGWVGGKEHIRMTATTSGTRGLKYGCRSDTLPLKLTYLIQEVIDEDEEDPRNVTSRSYIEYPGFGMKTYESEADPVKRERIRIEDQRLDNIQQFFQEKAWKSQIVKLEYSESEQGLVLMCTVKSRKRITFPFSKIYKLGLTEWMKIASLSDKISDSEMRMKIKTEVIYLVNAAFHLGYVDVPRYQVFCSENNVTIKSRSLGLDTTTEGINLHPVPQGISFADRMYVKTEQHEGLCYKDPINEECFQDINTIHWMSLHHCLALLRECEDQQCLPFRKRLISWLFNNLFQVKKMKGTKAKVEQILTEYQELFNQSDEEMKRLIKWKTDRIKLFRSQS